MAKLYLSIRDLEDADSVPIVGSTDPRLIEGVINLLADRLRGDVEARAVEARSNVRKLIEE